MQIAFDVMPLMQSQMTGIGYCAAGQIQALTRLHAEDAFFLQFFSQKDPQIWHESLKPYLRTNVTVQGVRASGYRYRLLSNFLPIPYRRYFGEAAQVTHFFNYIVPPGVSGKKVVTVHDMVYKTFPETVRGRTRYMLDTGLKRSLRRADAIVTDSEFSRTEIVRYFPWAAEKIRVVYCGVDLERFCPLTEAETPQVQAVRTQYQLERDYFLYLGTVEPRKNLERLIHAYDQFQKGQADPPDLVLAGGKGWLDSGIYGLVESLHLQKQVHFTGYVPDAAIRPLMGGALAFVFPSIYEGFGMPPLEAMACGVPVLTANAASLPEVVGEAAVLVEPDSVSSIAEGLEKLYTHPALRRELAAAGRKRAQQFTWEASAQQLYQVYQEVCRDK